MEDDFDDGEFLSKMLFGQDEKNQTLKAERKITRYYCPCCTNTSLGTAVKLEVRLNTKSKERFAGCVNWPKCKFSCDINKLNDKALTRLDIERWDAVTQVKVNQAMKKGAPDRYEYESSNVKITAPIKVPAARSNTDVLIEELQYQVANLNKSLHDTQTRLDKVEKSLQENEERRQKLGLEIF